MEIKAGEIVSAYCDELDRHVEAQIIQLSTNRDSAYIHFMRQDKRLDRWLPVNQLHPYVAEQQNPEEDHVKSRSASRMQDNYSNSDNDLTVEEQRFENIHREVTKMRYIDHITLGDYDIRTWYFSPYPKPFYNMNHFYVCEYCFQYFARKEELDQHLLEKQERHPLGKEIYRKDNISVFELQGKKQKLTCQCLCLLAKLFLDHKTLFYDVEGFNFYVLCECDQRGAHIAAYFSRELSSDVDNILACIVALPPYQKKGYGRMLISLSYELAKRQKRSGGPERPLSDLGKIAFNSYWRDTIVELLKIYGKRITSIEDIERMTSIQSIDIIETLKKISCVTKVKGEYELSINKDALGAAIEEFDNARPRRRIDPFKLIWFPEFDEDE
ncbi:MOZ/SAS family protein [Tritrichomonas foetus]|uniref:Histone acetyltransferase n=1 Tax=Tritrichomonas foetus TaxID=1144522 RepID=A0A1J4KE44_9EUKA|nr:MOZ/SAS family protein [Tritrichomonas foetus]|eukprot:OHT07733.1 MOZ/SAS family protein [Tritrichomonas foetus]